MRDYTVEFWRSRYAGRDLVYWRDVTFNGRCNPPDYGSPQALARLIWAARAKFGTPRRWVRNTAHGQIICLVWRARQFAFRPGAWRIN